MRCAAALVLLCAGCLTEYEVDRSLATEGGGGSATTLVGTTPTSNGSSGGSDCPERCRPGETCVEGLCIDTCGDACDGNTELCSDDVCECRPELTACGDSCVDILADPQHCGGCNSPCATVCDSGDCVAACTPPRQDCTGACVDTSTDPLHCSGCNDACDADEICIEGNCRDYEQAPCAACPCDECGSEVCCNAPPIPGPICVNDDVCPE